MAALVPAIAVVFLDQTILPVALPAIQKEFGASNVALQWSVNAYLLVICMLVLAGGKLSDRIGHRRSLLWGFFIFVLSSALCGFSPGIYWLIGSRALQGVGASLMFPAQPALLAALFPPSERGRATGISVSIGSLFLMLGPVLGGYLTEIASWRWIFWMNLPIALIGMPLIRLFLPSPPPTDGKIDGWGFGYFAVCAGSVVMFFMQGPEWGWLSKWTLSFAAAGIVSLILLIRREKKAAHPFLDLALFKHPIYSAINISVSMVQFIMMIAVFWSIYFQSILGYSPSQTGWITFVSCAPVFFCPRIGGWLSDKISPKLPISIGFILLIYSFFWLGFFSTPTLTFLLIPIIAYGIGIPFILTPSYSHAMSVVPPKKIGLAFGTIATLRMFAGTMGIALIGLVWDSVQMRHLAQGNTESQVAAFTFVHLMLAFLLVAAFAAVFVLHRRKSTHHLPEAPAEGWD